ncbi:MAG: hypothetical protein ACLP05_09240 [Candidatus Kryptoniota bacterium]
MDDNNTEAARQRAKQLDFWLPLILLSLVGLCIFLTENRDGGFVRSGIYTDMSVHGLALSKNLMNSEHPLFMFTSKEWHNGKAIYDAYNRFPVFPFLLIGLLTHPFEHNLVLQVYVARQLMNAFFFLAILVAYKLVDELVENKYFALTVALVAFSSCYMLTFNDMIFNDIPALLGFVVALYAVVAAQKTNLKTRHILFYSLFPICLGWQPYAVYVTWFLIDGFEMLVGKKGPAMKRVSEFIRQPAFVITGLAIVWGILVLGVQLLNEWRIVGGLFGNLPSVNSALWRTGFATASGHTQYLSSFDWRGYLPGQAHAIAIMLIPFWPILDVEPGLNVSALLVISLCVYSLLRYMKVRSAINKTHIIMVFSGLLWALIMKRFVALLNFELTFYVGFAISVYLILLSRVTPRAWKFLAADVALAFLIVVSLSNHFKTPSSEMNRITADFQNICNNLPVNSKVYIDGDRQQRIEFAPHAMDFFLAGRWFTSREEASYVISKSHDYDGERLTSNPDYNLFKVSDRH